MPGHRRAHRFHRHRRSFLSRSHRAELQFPVSRVERLLREGSYAQRLSSATPVFFAGVLEYLIANILEMASNEAHVNHRIRITPEHVESAMDNNPQLTRLVDVAMIVPETEKMAPAKK
ncbi:histone H2A-Bbd type 1-like [Echinops telfairi]|uniref:Histone H2A-Bbd type 1-like n=1 Tax=Echinops telfairi TaxID=9371 RepID=A0AC55CZH5_ECHTE|nr:histone H2A-Bbd type 1-like [Echinops telfairi]